LSEDGSGSFAGGHVTTSLRTSGPSLFWLLTLLLRLLLLEALLLACCSSYCRYRCCLYQTSWGGGRPTLLTLKGLRLLVTVAGDNRDYVGEVIAYDQGDDKHIVLFEDGEHEKLELAKEQIRWQGLARTRPFAAGMEGELDLHNTLHHMLVTRCVTRALQCTVLGGGAPPGRWYKEPSPCLNQYQCIVRGARPRWECVCCGSWGRERLLHYQTLIA
jgi:hypothetical protein